MLGLIRHLLAVIAMLLLIKRPGLCSKHDRPGIGIYLGTSNITTAILDGRGGVRRLALITGDDPYQAYIRRDLWSTGSAVLQPGKLDDHAQGLLQPIVAPTLTKVKPLLHELKSQILKHTGQDPYNVVVGVPGSFQWEHRSEIRKCLTHLLGPASTILATAGQPALATVAFDLHKFREETTVLVVDYNYASLDITVAETFNFMTDPFAHISLPLLGEDFLSLKLASLSSGDISAANYDILRSQARNISLHRMMEVDPHTTSGVYTSEIHAVEFEHFDTAISSMLHFLHQNTHQSLITGSNYKPVLSELTHILISGDASSRGFQGLRRAIASEKTILAGLLDPGLEVNASSPGWISAEGAAKNVQQRRFDDYGKWN